MVEVLGFALVLDSNWEIYCSDAWWIESNKSIFYHFWSFSLQLLLAHWLQSGSNAVVFVYKCLHKTAPPYIALWTVSVSRLQGLTASSMCFVDVSDCPLCPFISRQWPSRHCCVWSTLPHRVTSISLPPVFHKRLKTYLCQRCHYTDNERWVAHLAH